MPAAKQIEPDTFNKSLETDIEKNVYEVNRASDEMAANTIATCCAGRARPQLAKSITLSASFAAIATSLKATLRNTQN